MLRWHNAALREVFVAHSGEEISTTGDGFFVSFNSPDLAVEAAIAIQRRLAEHRSTQGFAPQVRIGLHASDATQVDGDFHGKGVHEAARIAALGGGGDIVASVATVGVAPDVRCAERGAQRRVRADRGRERRLALSLAGLLSAPPLLRSFKPGPRGPERGEPLPGASHYASRTASGASWRSTMAITASTSAAVALVVEDHEAHAATLEAVRGRRLGLAGHAWFETYSVLTRLPGGRRRSPADVAALLAHDFPATAFLADEAAAALGPELVRLSISGGAVYDALVGAAAPGIAAARTPGHQGRSWQVQSSRPDQSYAPPP